MQDTTVLMSSPEYFKVEYSINPWMVEGVNVDLDLAKQQWDNLKLTIEKAGAMVEVVPPNENYPDLVFTVIGSKKMDIQSQEFHQNLNLKEEVTHLF
jgi:hypothetical protein